MNRPRHHRGLKTGLQRADDLALRCSRHLLDSDTHIPAALGEAIAPVVVGITAKLADFVAEWVSGIGKEDAIDVERQEQTPRTVPHAWKSVGGVVVVDGVV